MYTSPEVRDLGAVQALTLTGSTLSGSLGVQKSNVNVQDSNFGKSSGLPFGTNCTVGSNQTNCNVVANLIGNAIS